MTNWTKEQLKSLAGVSQATRKEVGDISSDFSTDDVSKSKRRFNKRAIPKTIFSALILAPAFGLAYLFTSNNLNLDNQAKVKAHEPDAKTKQLQEELEDSHARIEELEAKLAVIKQEQSRPAPKVEETSSPAPEVEETVTSKPSESVAKPPPSKPVVRRPVTPQPVASSRVSSPSRPKAPPILPSVYGAGAIQDSESSIVEVAYAEDSNANYSEIKNSSIPTVRTPRGSLPLPETKRVILASEQLPNIDPALEVPLLQEQRMLTLRRFASAKASLAVPWLQDLSGRVEDAVFSVV